MASAEQLKALLKSHMDGDDAHFYSVAMQVAAREAKMGHGKLALELKKIIDNAKKKSSIDNTIEKNKAVIHIAQPRGEVANLLEVSFPILKINDMILTPPVARQLDRIILEQRNVHKIKNHGLHPRRKLLLVGPPGAGKTMTASMLAGELGLPLFIVRLDALITRFMGETSAKLRQIFDAIRDTRGVYFFDEFDAIGSQRNSTNDVGEMRRILNSFLMMIEQDNSNSLIISATNHPEILDYALFRRFDDIIEYELHDTDQIADVLKIRLNNYMNNRINWKKLAVHGIGLSYADITRASQDSIKDAVIRDLNKVSIDDVIFHLNERKGANFNNFVK